ncbi:hypothetical protein [Rugamonas aquatica]|uniref:Uncharacterized protein n=1 Tax=Rugamonas aquatica TaxID=2743357 RepID=A0A6A7N6X4_9BURK|nr:hypothetical protein [Rugamonas aquatica]MQA40749.1 hypothetical protein [Rugamonas aquatica]
MGEIIFTNLSGHKLDHRIKKDNILAVLGGISSLKRYRKKFGLPIWIILEHSPAIACVREKGDRLEVRLSPWFFTGQNLGRVLGMLAHELFVHSVPDKMMTTTQKIEERDLYDMPQQTCIPKHHINTGGNAQADHICGAIQDSYRYKCYRDGVYEMAEYMLKKQESVDATVTTTDIHDAILTYLSDLAMITATNDKRSDILKHPRRTAACFNHYLQEWRSFLTLKDTQEARQLLALTPGSKSAGSVIRETISLIFKWVLSPFRASVVDGAKTSSASTANLKKQT